MVITLNEPALQNAISLIRIGKVDRNDQGEWSKRNPSSSEEESFIARNGWAIYGWWHLGIDENLDLQTKKAYSFPFGDFQIVDRAGVVAAEKRAAQYGHTSIEAAAKELLALIDAS